MNRKVKLSVVLLVFALCVCCLPGTAAADSWKDWKLGMQAYSFNRFTFYEAVDKTKAIEMEYIEVYPGQTLSKDNPDIKTDHNMSAEARQMMLGKLREAGVKLTNYGVVPLPNNEAECRKVFDFAREMGIETIVSEPPEDAFDLIDKLCEEYKINVAIHNHPRPSHYWDPDTVLKVCKGRSKRIGACADTGHWTRSGVDPLGAVKKLGAAGRIVSLHFKDLNEFGNREAHDVPWGAGVSRAKAILTELDRQNFKGVFSIEYEYNWLDSMPEISKCVAFFRKTAAELSDVEYKDVFKKDLSNAIIGGKDWAFGADGVLAPTPTGHGDIWTKERYGNFMLELDFKVPEKGNSGVFIRGADLEHWIHTTIEIQIHATTDGTKHGQCGAVYDCLSPSKDTTKKPGEWNHYVITCLDNKIYVNLNGDEIIDMDLNQWTEAGRNPGPPVAAGTRNKFRYAYKDMAREGHLGFQYHGNPISFKNLKIKNLDPPYGDAVVLFDGKSLDNWQVKGDPDKSKWVVGAAAISPDDPKMLINKGGTGEMINLAAKHGDSLDIYSKQKFGDCRIELELMVPQGSNSGIYVMGEYEIQVLDSWGRTKMTGGDMGAVYGASPPPVNACKKPGEWQKYVIDFQAPRFDSSGRKVDNARLLKVELNGQILHENLTLDKETPGGVAGKEAPAGPLMFQGNHGPVAYRNIVVKPVND